MKHRKFQYNKLCRDKTVDRHEKNGSKTTWRQLSPEEFIEHLKLKLMEEAQEVCAAKTEDELHEELADLLEVICAFADLEQVMKIKEKKYQIRGGFELDFVHFWDRRPRNICSRGCLFKREGVFNPFPFK